MLLSIQAGRVRQHGTPDAASRLARPWRSGFFKNPVTGPVALGRTNLAGDEQYFEQHGGPDKAVLAYAAAHYPLWRQELDIPDMPYGGFGENFTIAGLDEDRVCVGDTFRVADALLQVTQPRQPCSNISRRWQRADLTRQVEKTGRTGWYLRVLREGEVRAGLPVELIDRPHPEWTITLATRTLRKRHKDHAAAAELAALSELSRSWQEALLDVA